MSKKKNVAKVSIWVTAIVGLLTLFGVPVPPVVQQGIAIVIEAAQDTVAEEATVTVEVEGLE